MKQGHFYWQRMKGEDFKSLTPLCQYNSVYIFHKHISTEGQLTQYSHYKFPFMVVGIILFSTSMGGAGNSRCLG